MTSNCNRKTKSVLLAAFAAAALSVSGCGWDDDAYQNYVNALGDNEAGSCENISYIHLEGVKATCTLDADGNCSKGSLVLTPTPGSTDLPDEEANPEQLIHNFNFDVCPTNFECKQASNENGDINYCVKKCGADQHLWTETGKCEDNQIDHCGAHGYDCNKLAGWQAGDCIQGRCVASECEMGYRLNESKDTCVPNCAPGTHYDNTAMKCVNDDKYNCGGTGKKCSDAIAQWVDGICDQGSCTVTKCEDGYKVFNKACLPDCGDEKHYDNDLAKCVDNDESNCGQKGYACKDHIKNSKKTTCESGKCIVTSCIDGYDLKKDLNLCSSSCTENEHYDNETGGCVNNSVEHCGQTGFDCAKKVLNWDTGTCEAGVCTLEKCKDGYSVYEQSVETIVGEGDEPAIDVIIKECRPNCDGEHYYDTYDSICKKSDTSNCGHLGNDCRNITGVNTATCIQNTCVALSCEEGYTLYNSTCISTATTCGSNTHYYNNVCEDDSLSNCGGHGIACSSTTIPGWSNGSCVSGVCEATACSSGYTLKDKKCISTATTCGSNTHYYNNACESDSVTNCGGHGIACSSTTIPGWSNGTCSSGKCEATACSSGYTLKDKKCISTATTCGSNTHYYNNACESDSVTNCGGHGIACSSTSIPGWSNGTCSSGKCEATACSSGYTLKDKKCISTATTCGSNTHYYNNACESDSLTNCGGHGIACTALPGWSNGSCSSGKCEATACSSGYTLKDKKCISTATTCGSNTHYYNNVCESDSVTNCGGHGIACSSTTIPGWSNGSCSSGKCEATACSSGYTLKDKKCISTATTCGSNTHYYNNSCESDSVTNCGGHGIACSSTTMPGWSKGACTSGKCVASECAKGYSLSSSGVCTAKALSCTASQHYYDGSCENNDATNCGGHGIACSSTTIPGWSTGSCASGKCEATACSSGYTLKDKKCISTATTCGSNTHYYNNSCETDSVTNCGGHGIACNSTTMPGWSKGACTSGKCVASECAKGYSLSSSGVCTAKALSCSASQHYYDGSCENNDVTNCGGHGIACSSTSIPGWSKGTCSSGKCVASECAKGYSLSNGVCSSVATTCTTAQHYYDGKCEANDVTNCGGHGIACSSTSIPGWSKGTCSSGKCVASECAKGYSLSNGVCSSVATTCTTAQHYYDGKCEANDVTNCGAHGASCASLAGWAGGSCSSGKCKATSCASGYSLNASNVCVLAILACGTNKTNCTTTAGWANGICNSSGSCVAVECKTGYTLKNGACTKQ